MLTGRHFAITYPLQKVAGRRVARLDGRLLRLALRYRDDSDLRYYGVGGDTSELDERALSRNQLVAEVTFGQLEGGRFRHGVKFVRWRPDRDPESCRFDQLEVAEPVEFASLFG